jgi:hypothetical protein
LLAMSAVSVMAVPSEVVDQPGGHWSQVP